MITMPMIHVGGTAPADLLEGAVDCANALTHALDVLRRNPPNARDYVLGGGFIPAMREHQERLRKVEAVLAEVRAVGEHVALGCGA
jgi:hypothetical protein